jgi:hypothetical protein
MNSQWHLLISVAKSITRISGCVVALIYKEWSLLAISFLIAEVLGVLEEVKDER